MGIGRRSDLQRPEPANGGEGMTMMAARTNMTGGSVGTTLPEDVVEVLLLLTASRMDALINLSRRRGQTVGQVLRSLIDREITQAELAC